MSEHVEYSLSLKDFFTGKVKDANQAVQALEGGLHHAGMSAKAFALELGAAVGVGFGIFKLVQLVEQGHEAWEKLEFSNSQLEAGLQSTGEAAGMTFEMLDEMSTRMSHAFKFTKSEVGDMQAQLLTFPKITKDVFEEASQAVLDMATRTHRGANELAIMVGKALQDPVRGIQAMRRVGVNFNEQQTEMIKKLVETGHAAKAQAAILKELNVEFGGSAGMAAAADKQFRFNKSMEELKLILGELAERLVELLMPVLEGFVDFLKDSIVWMKAHKDLLEAIAIGVGLAVAAWGAYLLVANAVTIATQVWTGIQWLLNAAMDANPIGLIIIAIAAVVTAVIYCIKHFAQFRATLLGVWETIKEFGRIVADVFMGLWHVIHGVFTFDVSEIKQGMNQGVDAIANAGKRMGEAFKKGFDEGMASSGLKDEENAPKTIAKKAKQGPVGPEGKAASAKATGSKNVVINIKIDNLVREFQVRTTNIREGAGQVKEMVAQALLSAVNDSQVTAGQ
jgi:hypothetical protein